MKFSLQMTIQNLGRAILRSFYDIRIVGSMPTTKEPVVLVANHSGFMDGFILFCATRRPIKVLTKTEVFNSISRPVLNAGGAIETDWKDADFFAIEHSRKTLNNQMDVGIFPEGSRCKGDFAWLKDGVILLNSEQRADFVPVFIFGTRQTGKAKNRIPPYKSVIEIVIGEPISASNVYFDDFSKSVRKDLAVAGERLRQQLQSQLLVCAKEVANHYQQTRWLDVRRY